MQFYYVLVDKVEFLPKGAEYVNDSFMEDYYIHYSNKFYSDYEMLFIDHIYQMILDSHLLEDNRFETITKTITNRVSILDASGIKEVAIEKEINHRHYHEYMRKDYYEKCRSYAKDIEFCLKNEEVDANYLIHQFKESETPNEFDKNIKKYLNTYYQFCSFLPYCPDSIQIVTAKKDICDWLAYHCIRFVTL